jgi:protein SERAC1
MHQALLLSKDSPENHLSAILPNTKAIAFLGTPHGGARALAEWAGHLASFVGLVTRVNKQLLATLETDSQILARIQQGFHTMLRARQKDGHPIVQMTCFYEQIPLRGIGYVSVMLMKGCVSIFITFRSSRPSLPYCRHTLLYR